MTTGWTPRPPDAGHPQGEHLPELEIPPPGRQRRWTVLLRLLLLLPQLIVTALLGIAAFFVTIVGWFAALVQGRLPDGIARFLGGFLAYETRVAASAMLLVDQYPPFSFEAPGHPVRIELRPGELNRLAVLFRLVLMIPAAIVTSLLQYGWAAVCWVFWLITLVLGRMPTAAFGAVAAMARFRMRYQAYVMMLTSAYPKRLFGDAPPAAALPAQAMSSGTRPLVLGTPAKVLIVLLLVLGIVVACASPTVQVSDDDWNDSSHAPTAPATTAGSEGPETALIRTS
ncbi:DUF4389 domain-containing protein [Streptomyces sp. NBC_00091]|uniref:DUF4389 domain-containing protein n=1 Tax=Streptomyces sp. NBC_00091 TaxID=2975648 RepID=UPI00224EDA04|nr:DUF4389 domain-containing protein [Streptomyces sp. NBC_00091]MCX5380451.1 DUF4389 domain-containing protein [Streptomyces sp. NBC_00091]